MAIRQCRIGVIGAGGRGGIARHAHRPEAGTAVVACCDVSTRALEQAKDWYGNIRTTTSLDELLGESLDAVMICSPDWLHEEQACRVLERGIAVFLEKPMAITIEGCDRILGAAQASGARLFVGHNMRYMNVFRKMKALIDEGAIGEVRSIWCRHFVSYGGDAYFRDWHSERKHVTGLLLQKGVHDIDMMHWLTGANCRRVSAFGNLSVYDRCGRRSADEPGQPRFDVSHWPPLAQTKMSPVIDVEDQTSMIMEMERGIVGSYLQCHFTPDACRNTTVIGTEGRLENLGDGPEAPIHVWNRRTDSFRMTGDQVHYGDPIDDDGGHGGADRLIVGEFLEYVTGARGETTATPIAARMAVAAGVQATRSLRSGGQPMDVPPIPESLKGPQ